VNIVIAEGDFVVAPVTMFATHTGELNFGYPASDRQVIAPAPTIRAQLPLIGRS
jgi:hypothetical protein